MGFLPLNTNNDLATNFNTVNDALRTLNNQQVVKAYKGTNGNAIIEGRLPYDGGYGSIYYDSNGLPSIIIGINPDGTIKIVQSYAGIDVTKATASQLAFDSSRGVFNILKTGTAVIPGTGNQAAFSSGNTSIAVFHGLGFVPAYSCFTLVPVNAATGVPSTLNKSLDCIGADSNQMTYNLQAGTDDNYLYLTDYWSNNGNICPVQAFTVTYYLYNTPAKQ